MVRITKDKRHDILKDGIRIGQIYLARAESRKLRYWAISCMSGIGFNTFNEAVGSVQDALPPFGGRFSRTCPQTVLACLHAYGSPLIT